MGVHKFGWMRIFAAGVCMLSVGCQGPEGPAGGAAATFPADSTVLRDIAAKAYGDQKYWQLLARANPDFKGRGLGPGGKITIPLGGRSSLGPLYSYDAPGARPEHTVNIYIAPADKEKLDVFIAAIRVPLARTVVIPRSAGEEIHSYMVVQAEPSVLSDAINWRLDLVIPLYSAGPDVGGLATAQSANPRETIRPDTAVRNIDGPDGPAATRSVLPSQSRPHFGPGQTTLLKWPAGSFKNYVVWEGDTVWEIAKKFYGSGENWMLIANANPTVDVHDLRAGQKLIIPPQDQASRPASTPAAELDNVLSPLSKPADGSEFQPAAVPAAVQSSRPISIASEPAPKRVSRPVSMPASQPAGGPDKRKVFAVAGADELIAAIGSDRIIRLKEGNYDLSSLLQRKMEHVLWTPVHDGSELTIRGVRNLRIEGPQGRPARLLVKPRYAYVLNFVDAEDLELADLVIGHDEEQPGFCTGGVLNIRESRKIAISRCELFGCGTQGLSLSDVAALRFEDSTIKKCTEGIMVASACRDLVFRKARFMDNEQYNGVILIDNRGVLFEDCLFSGNVIKGVDGRGILFDISSCTDVAVKGGLIKKNVFSELVKPEKAAAFVDVKLEDNRKQ
ncbi:MAG: LysM peptidoglycan-binding domain-containing protein [Planctomycetes bacterium]|nr:LysM peptidoglycan-binding domain-containing protein [Planctomycetota bacterium]